MFDAAMTALSNIATVEVMTYLIIGVLIGSLVGVLPGLGGVTGLALVLPFLIGMDPFAGIALMVGVTAVTQTSDIFASVLIGVPGSSGSQATILDGYPLAKRGEAARALGASFSGSLIGGLIGAVALLLMIGVSRSVVQAVGSPQLLMFSVMGIAIVGVLVKGDPLLGISSAVVGVMISLIGGAPATGEYRYTFGELYLYDGISIMIFALGIFAVPEVVQLLLNKGNIASSELKGSVWDGFRETWHHKATVMRASLIGIGVGVIPGIGGSVLDWITYGVEKQVARDNSQFGHGDIRGVIGPGSADNAKEGGSLVPTLLLGIPGGASMAVILGGLVILGITPGPAMVTRHLDLTLTVIWSLVLANVFATLLCSFLARYIARLTNVPGTILAPLLLVLFLGASFQASHHVGDLIALFLVGLMGYLMKIAGWPRAPAIIGFVLAGSVERYLHLSVSRYGMSWTRQPSVIAFAVVIVLLLALPGLLQRRRNRRERAAAAAADPTSS